MENSIQNDADKILQKNGDLMGMIFDNIFIGNELDIAEQLIITYTTFSCAIEAFAHTIRGAGVLDWEFENMISGINRAYELSKKQIEEEKDEQ